MAGHYGVGKKQVKLADGELVVHVTGYPVGGVPPFGFPDPVPVFLDTAIRACELVYGGGGDDHTMMRLAVSELARVTGGTWLYLGGNSAAQAGVVSDGSVQELVSGS